MSCCPLSAIRLGLPGLFSIHPVNTQDGQTDNTQRPRLPREAMQTYVQQLSSSLQRCEGGNPGDGLSRRFREGIRAEIRVEGSYRCC